MGKPSASGRRPAGAGSGEGHDNSNGRGGNPNHGNADGGGPPHPDLSYWQGDDRRGQRQPHHPHHPSQPPNNQHQSPFGGPPQRREARPPTHSHANAGHQTQQPQHRQPANGGGVDEFGRSLQPPEAAGQEWGRPRGEHMGHPTASSGSYASLANAPGSYAGLATAGQPGSNARPLGLTATNGNSAGRPRGGGIEGGAPGGNAAQSTASHAPAPIDPNPIHPATANAPNALASLGATAVAASKAAPASALKRGHGQGSEKGRQGILKRGTGVHRAGAISGDAGESAPSAAGGGTAGERGGEKEGEGREKDGGGTGGEHKRIRFAPTPEKPKRNPSPDKIPGVRPSNLFGTGPGQPNNPGNLAAANMSTRHPSTRKGPKSWDMPCRYHPAHRWGDCPNNPKSKHFCGVDHRSMNFSTSVVKTAAAGAAKPPPAGSLLAGLPSGASSGARAAGAPPGMFRPSHKAAAKGNGPVPRRATTDAAGSIPRKAQFAPPPQNLSVAQQIVAEVQAEVGGRAIGSPEKQSQPTQGMQPAHQRQPGQQPPGTQQHRRQVRRQEPASGMFNTTRAARPLPRRPDSGATSPRPPAHAHIQDRQPTRAPATREVALGYKPGVRGLPRRGRAPVGASDPAAVALKKDRGSRLMKGKGKSAFAGPRDGREDSGEAGLRASPSGGSLASQASVAAEAKGNGGDDDSDAGSHHTDLGDEGDATGFSSDEEEDAPLLRRAASNGSGRVLASSDDEGAPKDVPAAAPKKRKGRAEFLDDSDSESESEEEGADDDDEDNLPMMRLHRRARHKGGGSSALAGRADEGDSAGGEDDSTGEGSMDDGSDAGGATNREDDGTDGDSDSNDEGDDQSHGSQPTVAPELDDAALAAMEGDMFGLVERTLEIAHRWEEQIRGLGLADGWEQHQKDEAHAATEPGPEDENTSMDVDLGNGRGGPDAAEDRPASSAVQEGSHEAATGAAKAPKKRREKRKLKDGRKSKRPRDADWTDEERAGLDRGLRACGEDWGAIARDHVPSRSPFQPRAADASPRHGDPGPEESHGTDGEGDEESTLSDESMAPAFVTCDKCHLVLGNVDDVFAHEERCALTEEDRREGRVFGDKHELVLHIVDFQAATGRHLREADRIFFVEGAVEDRQRQRPGRDGPTGPGENGAPRPSPPEEARGDEGLEGEGEEYNRVPHLCATTVDAATGLPAQKLTIICHRTETLYDFRVDIKQSTIPAAGHGAFLTYLGARVLRKPAAERSERLWSQHIWTDDTAYHLTQLTAQTEGGRKMSVKVTGDNVHRNENSVYWTKARLDKFAEFERKSSSSPRSWSRSSAMESFDEDDVLCKVHDEVKRLRKKIPAGQRIGFLGIHSEEDYKSANDEMFSSRTHIFELGRYGPHRPEDRKDKLSFDFKNWIHSNEPSEWSYEVPEPMLGYKKRQQMVDITDDLTGEVHSLARAVTPPYVNEVGHNSKLHRNVYIRDKNDRSIYYWVHIDEEHAMKKGDTVELLVDYDEHYEQVRERKGYGRVNMSQGVGGDEEDGARLRRNFVERGEIEEDISDMVLPEMYHLVEFLTKEIFDPLNTSIRRSFGGVEGGTEAPMVTGRELVARRRLHWIAEKLAGRVEQYIGDPKVKFKPSFVSSLVSNIQASLRRWRFSALPAIFHKLDDDLTNAVVDELSEELFYEARSRLPNALDQTAWSALAVDLMGETAKHIALYYICYSGPMNVRLGLLRDYILAKARGAAERLREGSNAIHGVSSGALPKDAVEEYIDSLSFKSYKYNVKKAELLDASTGKMKSMYGSTDKTIRFGTAAAMADVQAYYDAVELCGIESHYVPGKTERLAECDRSIVGQYEPADSSDADKRSPQFRWMARSVDAFTNGVARVNVRWYLENQVLLAVHLLASTCVDWDCVEWENGAEAYSLEKLCDAINLDMNDANRALKLGAVNPSWPELDAPPAQSSESTSEGPRRIRRRQATNRLPALSVSHDGPDLDHPGWNVKVVPRATTTFRKGDYYWYHPDVGDGVLVRSTKGLKAMINYMESKGVGAREAFEYYRDTKTYFKKFRM